MSNQGLAYCTTNYKILVSPCAGNSNWPDFFFRAEQMEEEKKMLVNKKHHKEFLSTRCVCVCVCVWTGVGGNRRVVNSVFIHPTLYQASVGH